MPSYASAFARETVTVSSSPVGLTASVYSAHGEAVIDRVTAKEAFVTVENAAIRITFEGTAPNDGSDIGHVIPAGSGFNIYGFGNIKNFRAIRIGDTDAVLNVTYFRG